MIAANPQNANSISRLQWLTPIFTVCFLCLLTLGAVHATGLPGTAVDTSVIPAINIPSGNRDDEPLPYYKISKDTYFLYANISELNKQNRGFNGNAGFVVTAEGVVVIDSLGTPKLGRRLIATIRKVSNLPIRYLIITHHHPDHYFGAIAFRQIPGIKIIAHEGILDYLNSGNMQLSADFRRELLGADMEGFQAAKPDIALGGLPYKAYSFALGGKTFAVYNTGKHHSFGDLVVHQVDAGNIWISDLAFNQRTTFMGDGHSAEILEAITWLQKKFPDIKLVIPGHGSAQTAPFAMLHKTYDYIERLRSKMRYAIESGLGIDEAVKRSDFEEWHGTRLYRENHPRNAHFIYLEMEQEVFFGK